jgi:4-amino-4-deoxy-L-arabinose transferase-like glycosyltransferase
MRIHFKKIALLLLLCIAGFLRLYHIDRYMQYQGDEGRDALVLWRMVSQHKFTLIGPGTSIGNMYNGPLYYYLVLPSFIISGLSPVGPSIFVAIIGVATVWLIYQVGREWFSSLAASTAAVLYTFSPTVIIYSRSSWNPNVMPFFALLCIYALWRTYMSQSHRWLYLLAVSLAFAIQSHYLGLLLIPTIMIWWFFAYRKSPLDIKVAFKRSSIYAVIIFLLLMSPIVLFDIRHNFINLKAMWIFFTQRQTTVNFKVYKALPEFIPLLAKIATRLLAASQENLGRLVAVLMGLGSIVLLVKLYKKPAIWLLFTWVVVGLIGLGLYKQTIYDHYFGFLFPAFFLLIGAIFGYLWDRGVWYKPFVFGGLIGLIWTAILNNPLWGEPNNLYQHSQLVSNKIIQESQGQPFNLGMIAKNNYDAGYRFILKSSSAPIKEIPPDITEQLFVVCELKVSDCNPVGHPQAEIANFGWTKIDKAWYFPWGTTLFHLVHNR